MVKFSPIRLSPGTLTAVILLPQVRDHPFDIPPVEWVSCARILQTHRRKCVVIILHKCTLWYHGKEEGVHAETGCLSSFRSRGGGGVYGGEGRSKDAGEYVDVYARDPGQYHIVAACHSSIDVASVE